MNNFSISMIRIFLIGFISMILSMFFQTGIFRENSAKVPSETAQDTESLLCDLPVNGLIWGMKEEAFPETFTIDEKKQVSENIWQYVLSDPVSVYGTESKVVLLLDEKFSLIGISGNCADPEKMKGSLDQLLPGCRTYYRTGNDYQIWYSGKVSDYYDVSALEAAFLAQFEENPDAEVFCRHL